jgi:hypothetical protein
VTTHRQRRRQRGDTAVDTVVDARLTGAQNTAYGFDAAGNVQRVQYPNTVTNLYQYSNRAERLKRVV